MILSPDLESAPLRMQATIGANARKEKLLPLAAF
jgi:hypothetical protein